MWYILRTQRPGLKIRHILYRVPGSVLCFRKFRSFRSKNTKEDFCGVRVECPRCMYSSVYFPWMRVHCIMVVANTSMMTRVVCGGVILCAMDLPTPHRSAKTSSWLPSGVLWDVKYMARLNKHACTCTPASPSDSRLARCIAAWAGEVLVCRLAVSGTPSQRCFKDGFKLLPSPTFANFHRAYCFPQDGDRAIHLAIQNGDQEIVNLLVEYQADINSPNYRRVTPLAVACKNQDWQMVNHLLDKKARC